MAKKILLVSLLVGGLVLSWSSCGLASYNIDGLLDDWGVTPFYGWTPSPIGNRDFEEEDWTETVYPGYDGTGSKPLGGECYDIEAMYFDDDPNYIYLAMVTSFAFNRSGAGDIAIGFGSSGDYEYGIKVKGLSPSQYGHRFVSLRELGPGDDWTYGKLSAGGPVYLKGSTGDDIGLAEIFYWNATDGGGPYNEPETCTHTWVLEAKLNRLLFDGLAQQGNTIHLHHSMICSNDWIDLTGKFDTPLIPEPASLFLFGSSLLGLVGVKIGRRKRHTIRSKG